MSIGYELEARELGVLLKIPNLYIETKVKDDDYDNLLFTVGTSSTHNSFIEVAIDHTSRDCRTLDNTNLQYRPLYPKNEVKGIWKGELHKSILEIKTSPLTTIDFKEESILQIKRLEEVVYFLELALILDAFDTDFYKPQIDLYDHYKRNSTDYKSNGLNNSIWQMNKGFYDSHAAKYSIEELIKNRAKAYINEVIEIENSIRDDKEIKPRKKSIADWYNAICDNNTQLKNCIERKLQRKNIVDLYFNDRSRQILKQWDVMIPKIKSWQDENLLNVHNRTSKKTNKCSLKDLKLTTLNQQLTQGATYWWDLYSFDTIKPIYSIQHKDVWASRYSIQSNGSIKLGKICSSATAINMRYIFGKSKISYIAWSQLAKRIMNNIDNDMDLLKVKNFYAELSKNPQDRMKYFDNHWATKAGSDIVDQMWDFCDRVKGLVFCISWSIWCLTSYRSYRNNILDKLVGEQKQYFTLLRKTSLSDIIKESFSHQEVKKLLTPMIDEITKYVSTVLNIEKNFKIPTRFKKNSNDQYTNELEEGSAFSISRMIQLIIAEGRSCLEITGKSIYPFQLDNDKSNSILKDNIVFEGRVHDCNQIRTHKELSLYLEKCTSAWQNISSGISPEISEEHKNLQENLYMIDPYLINDRTDCGYIQLQDNSYPYLIDEQTSKRLLNNERMSHNDHYKLNSHNTKNKILVKTLDVGFKI